MSGETAAVVRGRVYGTVQLRHTERGTPAARFTVMQVPREYDRARGQWRDGEPVPVICTVTGPLARHIAECLTDAVHVIATGNVALRDNVLYLDSAQVGVDLATTSPTSTTPCPPSWPDVPPLRPHVRRSRP
ncbi:single-stranded DNA-binding protein [Streptomyces sp. NPDC056704]|uniref:single-stranded DNA-binding protein n=1 Tax=Streptomyces sp. NPDC056704 TaxID=3345917 RepID=UPI0036BC1061